jgi:hypothetical protein
MTKPEDTLFVSYSYAEQYEMRQERERQKRPSTFLEEMSRRKPKVSVKGVIKKDISDDIKDFYNTIIPLKCYIILYK